MDLSEEKPAKMKPQRTTQEQLQYFVAFCKSHPELQAGKNYPKAPRRIQELWSDLAERLNSMRGPTRTAKNWKEILSHWKNQLRSRARKHRVEQLATGGGPPPKSLNEMEEHAISVFGSAAVDGIEDVIIMGFEAENDNLLQIERVSETVGLEETSLSDTLPQAVSSPTTPPISFSLSTDVNDDVVISPTPFTPAASAQKRVTPESLLAEMRYSVEKRNEVQERALKQQETFNVSLLQQQEQTTAALKQIGEALITLAQAISKK